MSRAVPAEKAFTDEEDDSFEKIEINYLESSDGEEDERIAALEKELALAHVENKRLQKTCDDNWKSMTKVHALCLGILFGVLLPISLLGPNRPPSPPHSSPSSTPCPSLETPPQCEKESDCACADRELWITKQAGGGYGFTLKEGFVKEARFGDLEMGDEIVRVDGVDVQEREAAEIYDMIYNCDQGKEGNGCALVVRRNPVAFKRLETATTRAFKRGAILASLLTALAFLLSYRLFRQPQRMTTNTTAKINNGMGKVMDVVEPEEMDEGSEEESDEEDEEEKEEEEEEEKNEEEEEEEKEEDECSTQEESDAEEEEPFHEKEKEDQEGNLEEMHSAQVDENKGGWLEQTLEEFLHEKKSETEE